MRIGLAIFAAGALIAAVPTPTGKSEHPAPPHAPSWELSLLPALPDSGTLVIEGRVLREDGQPARDLRLHVYHADKNGSYSPGAGGKLLHSGLLRTNVLGQFRVLTELPGMAEGSPHVHFEIELAGDKYRAIPLNLARSAGAGSDARFARLPWMVVLPDPAMWGYVMPQPGGSFRCRWDLRLAKSVWIGEQPEAFKSR